MAAGFGIRRRSQEDGPKRVELTASVVNRLGATQDLRVRKAATAAPGLRELAPDDWLRPLADLSGSVLFANSDLSGFSIIEEAQYRGVRAAERALERLGGRS